MKNKVIKKNLIVFLILISLVLKSQITLNSCDPYSGINDGSPIKVVIYNSDGHCFNLMTNGIKVVPYLTSNATFYSKHGKTKLVIVIDEKEQIIEEVNFKNVWGGVTYELIKNRKGKWYLDKKNIILNDAGLALQAKLATNANNGLSEIKARQDENQKQAELEWKSKVEKQSSSVIVESYKKEGIPENQTLNTTEILPSVSSTNEVYDKNKTQITLKFTFKNQPITDTHITVKNRKTTTNEYVFVGEGITNKDGVLKFFTDKIFDLNVVIFADKNNTNWNLSGLQMDTDLDTHFAIDKILDNMAKLMGVNNETFYKTYGF